MFGLNLKAAAVLAALTTLGGLATGWTVRDAFCDAAALKLQVETLHEDKRRLALLIARMRLAAEQDATKHATDASEIERLERLINETTMDSGICFPAADADRVRGLWK